MKPAEGIEPKRSEEYVGFLKELKHAFVSAANVAVKLYEQGKKDGLSNEAIRKDIETTFDGIVKERRLGEILPAELKWSYTQAPNSDSAIRKADVGSSKLQRKNKSNKVLTPQQSVALIASIIIIIIAFGGLGLVYNVFAQNHSHNQNQTQSNLTIYENKEHRFAFDYPALWHNEYDANEARLNNVVIALADPYSNDTDGFETTIFRVNVSDVHKYLDDDLQIKADTAEDYVRNKIKAEIKVDEDTNYLLRGGENASKVQYIQSYEGEQKVFNIFIYVVKNDKVYELSFYSEPLKVPKALPMVENILKSFRFIKSG